MSRFPATGNRFPHSVQLQEYRERFSPEETRHWGKFVVSWWLKRQIEQSETRPAVARHGPDNWRCMYAKLKLSRAKLANSEVTDEGAGPEEIIYKVFVVIIAVGPARASRPIAWFPRCPPVGLMVQIPDRAGGNESQVSIPSAREFERIEEVGVKIRRLN